MRGMAQRAAHNIIIRIVLLLPVVVASCSGSFVTQYPMSFRPVPFGQGNNVPRLPLEVAGAASKQRNTSAPKRFLEVSRPVVVPAGVQLCSVRLLEHSFAHTYGQPPAKADLKLPAEEECGNQWDKVVLKWKGTCKGRQFDRLSVVWLNGVEIFRTCTAEPEPEGIVWEVEKDVTRYSALFQETAQLVVSLENVVDGNYTGIFHITLEALFYPSIAPSKAPSLGQFSESADVIVPLSLVPGGGFIQRIQNSSHIVSVTTNSIPKNVVRAVVEVCVSFHEKDEFWYTNPPDAWIQKNNLSGGHQGDGPFREVVVALDGRTVGAVWPFPVVYTGGLNPYLWRPLAAIGAFNIPSYDIELTPFVGQMVDGESHTFSFSVTNSLNVWYVQGNLHLWLDAHSSQTEGRLVNYWAPHPSRKLHAQGFNGGLDGSFTTSAFRRISYSGYVNSSLGKVVSKVAYWYRFRNTLVYANQTGVTKIDQETTVDSEILLKTEKRELVNEEHFLSFPFRLNYREYELADSSIKASLNLTHAFDHDVYLPNSSLPSGHTFTSNRNFQNVSGTLIFHPNRIGSHWEESNQQYVFASSYEIYARDVVAKNGTVCSDSTVREDTGLLP